MSRIGKQPVVVPAGVTITIAADNVVTVKGPKGQLTETIDRDIKVEVKENEIIVTRPTDQIRHRAMHGLYRSLLSNTVKGVTDGYTKRFRISGCGF
jgi:large subunit ribosomal protein L6